MSAKTEAGQGELNILRDEKSIYKPPPGSYCTHTHTILTIGKRTCVCVYGVLIKIYRRDNTH